MKILFVIPNQRIRYKPSIDLPLGVLSIASYLKQSGFDGEVEVYDANLSGQMWSDENGNKYLGDHPHQIRKKIEDYKPTLVAISNMFSFQLEQALLVARLSKDIDQDIITVIGGPHASSFPKEMAEEPNIDYVVMGEGEVRFSELVKAIESGRRHQIQGIVKDESDLGLLKPSRRSPIRFIPDLDQLPYPAYEMVDVERYFSLQRKGFSSRPRSKGSRTVSMLTSRGCPHQCIFCSIQATMGYKWRHNSPEYVEKHIEHLIEKYDIDYIHFEDDNFTHDPDRYDSILEVLVNLPKRLRWDSPNGIRGDTWTDERVRLTSESGCQYLIVAIESGIQAVLDNVVKKKLDLSKVDELMKGCKKNNLRLYAFYVVGLPGETEKDIQGTVDYALEKFKKYDVLPTINKTKTLPGTELYDIVYSNKFYKDQLSFDENSIVTNEFSPDIVERLYNQFTIRLIGIALQKCLTKPTMMLTFFRLALGYKWFLSRMVKDVLEGLATSNMLTKRLSTNAD